MNFILGFHTVHTSFALYMVVDKEGGVLKYVKEFNTKGHALQWVSKSGEKGSDYRVQQHFRKKVSVSGYSTRPA